MVQRIAQQVFERSDQFFQHGAIELDLRSAYLEIRALVELLGCLTENAVETLRQAAEGHRANRKQLLLHVAGKPRLRQERRVGLVEILQQRLLDRRNVIDAFGEASRQLLESRVAVELQGIEAFRRLVDHRHPRLDLRFGLDLDFANLRPQANHAAGQFEQIALQRVQLAFDAGASDGDLARLVDQTIDKVGTHAQHRPGLGIRAGRLHARGGRRDLSRIRRLRRYGQCRNHRRRRR